MAERTPTANEVAGMEWWNGMTEAQRATTMQLAKATTAAAAWDWHQLGQQEAHESARDTSSWSVAIDGNPDRKDGRGRSSTTSKPAERFR